MTDSISFARLEEDMVPGMSRLTCDAMGECTFVGWSKEGCAVVQKDDMFTSLPETAFNMMFWRKPFDPETHVRYITEESLALLNRDYEGAEMFLSTEKTALHKYSVTMHIHEVEEGIEQ